MIKILLCIIILIITIYLYNSYIKNNNLIIEGLDTFTGRMAIDDQYYYDKLFDDVYYYPNEEDGTTGWAKCKSECSGHCVEFGVHGVSYCFPY